MMKSKLLQKKYYGLNKSRVGLDSQHENDSSTPWRIAVGTHIATRPPGGRRRSPASGSHRTQRADFPHWARQKWIHSLARAFSSG
jgi:hypothetical protein